MVKGKRKNKIHYKRLALVIVVSILLISVLGVGMSMLLNNNPYAKYDVYEEGNKRAGTMEHYTKTEDDQYHHSFYYPKFEDEALNKIIASYRDKNLTYKDSEGMYYTNVDYSSDEVFEQYITLSFHKTVKNEEEKILQESWEYINYDKKAKKVLTVNDVLRREYITMMKKNHGEIAVDSINMSTLNQFLIGKEQIVFHIDGKKLPIKYKNYAKYIKLKNSKIDSLYQQETIVTKQQKVDPSKPMIAFTFDDGPHATNTDAIMKEFEKYGGSATFFMLGKNAAIYPDMVKQIYERGFELGNHSWDHSMRIAANKIDFMSKEEVIDEIYNTQDTIYKVCGEEPSYFRPPYGALNQNVREVSTLGFALWNVDTKDWKNRDGNVISQNIMNDVKDGAVILLHDIYDTSADAIKKALPQLHEQGYQFVSLSTLMQHKGDSLLNENAVIKMQN